MTVEERAFLRFAQDFRFGQRPSPFVAVLFPKQTLVQLRRKSTFSAEPPSDVSAAAARAAICWCGPKAMKLRLDGKIHLVLGHSGMCFCSAAYTFELMEGLLPSSISALYKSRGQQ